MAAEDLISEPSRREFQGLRFQSFDSCCFSPQALPMSEPWADIIATFRQKRTFGDDAFRKAIVGLEEVAILIAGGPLQHSLFGWTSMHDLCIQQTDTAPYSGPYVRLSPLPSGMIEFRYIDTAIVNRQWQRTVSADAAPARFISFLKQLSWARGVTSAASGFTT